MILAAWAAWQGPGPQFRPLRVTESGWNAAVLYIQHPQVLRVSLLSLDRDPA